MPIRKYRSVEEMAQGPRPVPPDAGAGIAAAVSLSAAAQWLSGRRFPRGVHRFRSVEESRAWQEAVPRREPGAPDR